MSRPRIRTIKPEMWQDERIGQLSRDARLLLIGMITMADDEGRLRAMPSLICGHCFPYDQDAPKRVAAWIAELTATGLILTYERGGVQYAAFRHWRRHQRVNRATPSTLPAPDDHGVVAENSVIEEVAA